MCREESKATLHNRAKFEVNIHDIKLQNEIDLNNSLRTIPKARRVRSSSLAPKTRGFQS